MNRRQFVFSVTALAAIPLTPKLGAQDKITWVEATFDCDHQFAIAGEYNGIRQAVRLKQHSSLIDECDRQKMKQVLTDWFIEKGHLKNAIT